MCKASRITFHFDDVSINYLYNYIFFRSISHSSFFFDVYWYLSVMIRLLMLLAFCQLWSSLLMFIYILTVMIKFIDAY